MNPLLRPVVAHYYVVHQTDYRYQNLVTLSQQYLHLSPRTFSFQEVLNDFISSAESKKITLLIEGYSNYLNES